MNDYLNVGEDNDGWYVARGNEQIMFGLTEENATEVCSLFKTIEQLTARVRELEEERDEADRRAGAAERIQERDREAAMARDSWLRKAKEQWGVSNSVSFDVVWDEALQLRAKLSQSESERMALGEHLSKQLAASQLHAEQLREALKFAQSIIGHPDDEVSKYLVETISLTRQRDLAVEALERIAQNKYSGLSTASIPPLDQRAIWAEHAISTIKESEAK